MGQVKKESESPSVVSNSLQPHGLYSPWNSPGQNTGVGSLSLLQGMFLAQGLNPGLPHCMQILYQMSHQGSPTQSGLRQFSIRNGPCAHSRQSPSSQVNTSIINDYFCLCISGITQYVFIYILSLA